MSTGDILARDSYTLTKVSFYRQHGQCEVCTCPGRIEGKGASPGKSGEASDFCHLCHQTLCVEGSLLTVLAGPLNRKMLNIKLGWTRKLSEMYCQFGKGSQVTRVP